MESSRSYVRYIKGIAFAIGVPFFVGGMNCCTGAYLFAFFQESKTSQPLSPRAEQCPTAVKGFQSQLTISAKERVFIEVWGPTTASRPQFLVLDTQGTVVANSGASPESMIARADFVPAATGEFTIAVVECEPTQDGTYELKASRVANGCSI